MIAVYTIAKNEEQFVERWYESAARLRAVEIGWVDENIEDNETFEDLDIPDTPEV